MGVDILDLKSNEEFVILATYNGLYTQNALNRSSNIYLLSEQGYMALVMLMRTEKVKYLCTNNTGVLQNKTEHWF